MSGLKHFLAALSHFLHRHFIWLLLGAYALAAAYPGPGLWIKDVAFGEVGLFGERTLVTLPMLMLALLLFNAGLGVQPSTLRHARRGSLLLLAGLAASLAVPVTFIFGLAQAMRPWHDPDEVQTILVGLALVASMPVAGSSTAWSQNADGDMALSLGLVLLTTLLSPLLTPVALHAVGRMATGEYAAQLHRLAAQGTGGFLAVCVALPSFAGVCGRAAVGGPRADAARPYLKLVNSVTLLVLNYSNGAVSLPRAAAERDWDFLGLALGIALALCVAGFASGWWLGGLLRADRRQRTSLMFGLGMSNNGAGLVLASVALPGHPRVMLPLIFYNLVQHLVAAVVTYLLNSGRGARAEADTEGRHGHTGAWPRKVTERAADGLSAGASQGGRPCGPST
jgi:BASS family bile acid:Na+ symporter